MKKQTIALFILLGLAIIVSLLVARTWKGEPVTIRENSSLRAMSIDDKIREAEIIIIGEVKTTLPSKWKLQDKKSAEDATPKEISDAGGLFTDCIISIDKLLKGSVDKTIIRVRAFSGETEGVRWINSSQPSYEKGHIYLLFLGKGFGPTANVDPGHYRSVNADTAVYEIIDGKAISSDDEWVLDELIAYIQKSLSPTP